MIYKAILVGLGSGSSSCWMSHSPQPLVFKILQDKVDALDEFKEGDRVRVVLSSKEMAKASGQVEFYKFGVLSVEAVEPENTELSSSRKE